MRTIIAMKGGGCKFTLAWAMVLAAGGCNKQYPPVVLETSGVAPGLGTAELAYVLTEAVATDGRVKVGALKRSAGRLDAQLKRLAVTGPTATPKLLPTAEHRLAYWYNARAAWAMKLLLLRDCPEELSDAALLRRRFPLDGRTMTLEDIDAILAAEANLRAVVAAPGVTFQRARLPSRPLAPDDVRRRIAERFAEFIDDKERFVVDVPGRRVRVPPVLWQFHQRLIRHHQATYGTEGATLTTALLAYVTGSPHRRLQDAIGYPCVAGRPDRRTARIE